MTLTWASFQGVKCLPLLPRSPFTSTLFSVANLRSVGVFILLGNENRKKVVTGFLQESVETPGRPGNDTQNEYHEDGLHPPNSSRVMY